MTQEELIDLANYAYAEMMEFMESNLLDPQNNYCFRESTGEEKIPSSCEATTVFTVDEHGHGLSDIAETEHCSFDWTPSPGGTGGAVWHYDKADGWKFVKSYE